MSGSTAVLTLSTRSHLSGALTLLDSVHAFHPDWRAILVLVDEPADRIQGLPSWIELVPAPSLSVPHWKRLVFQYDPMSLCCALKPHALRHVLTRLNVEVALYFDSDIMVFQPLNELRRELNTCSILVTPHHVRPLAADGSNRSEELSHFSGVYNMGFLGLRATPNALACLDWWSGKVSHRCVNRPEASLWYDQAFMSAAPALFDGVRVERGPQYNLAPWNLYARPLQRVQDRFLVEGRPLIFFHFSGFKPDHPEQLSSHYQRADSEELRSLLDRYAAALLAQGYGASSPPPYPYDCLRDGTPIRPLWREAIRLDLAEFRDVEDPFAPELRERYLAAEDLAFRKGSTSAQFEAWYWKRCYHRLASAFPVRQLRWLRRKILGIPDSTI